MRFKLHRIALHPCRAAHEAGIAIWYTSLLPNEMVNEYVKCLDCGSCLHRNYVCSLDYCPVCGACNPEPESE